MKNKEKNGIFHQFLRPLAVFQIVLMILMPAAMYIFSLFPFWAEKKESSQMYSNYTADMLGEYQCIGRIIGYLRDNYKDIEFIYDSETAAVKEKELSECFPGYTIPEKVTPEQFDAMPDNVRKLYAEVCYAKMSLDMDKMRQNYDILYLAAFVIVDDNFFCIAQGTNDGELRISQGGDMYELGTTDPYIIGEYPALDKLLGLDDNAFLLPIFDATDEEGVYTIAPVYDENGEMAVIVLTANKWSGILLEDLKFVSIIIVLLLILMIIQSVKTKTLLSKVIIQPIQKEQDILKEYIENKDSEKAVSELAGIKTNNEIQTLAENFSYMATEIDRYIGEVRSVTAEKERIGAELSLATSIQSGMLPNIFPAFPERKEFDIFASMDPAKEVGGDFYDFFFIDDDHLAMVIADVSGKGVPAALFMMSSMILINDHALMGGTPAEILDRVNKQICKTNKAQMFVTVWLGILEISTGKLTASSAGHEFPMINTSGKFELLKDKHGMPVGAFNIAKYKDYELTLKKGDSIFLYTDGVAEATDADDQLFGTDRTLAALNENPDAAPEELLKNVRVAVDAFVKDAPQFDDLTMLGFRYFGKEENKDE